MYRKNSMCWFRNCLWFQASRRSWSISPADNRRLLYLGSIEMWEDLTSIDWLLFRLGCAFSHRTQWCLLIKLVSPILFTYLYTHIYWWTLEIQIVLKWFFKIIVFRVRFILQISHTFWDSTKGTDFRFYFISSSMY